MQYRQQCVTHSRHRLNHEELNLVKHSLGAPKQFAFGKQSCPTTHSFVQDWPKICADDTVCGSSEVAAAGWKEAHTADVTNVDGVKSRLLCENPSIIP